MSDVPTPRDTQAATGAGGVVRLVVLGSTGSVGRQTLEVARAHPDRVKVVGLAARSGWELLSRQAAEFGVEHVALAGVDAAELAQGALPGVDVGAGREAVVSLAALAGADIVLNALVGAVGLRASLATLGSGARLALANKESLVVAGELITGAAAPGALVPVDSEHSALFQCLAGEPAHRIARLWITASGGPFRGRSRAQLASVTRAEALAHPRWTMGPKITVDSATLMNKGLEVIEAHHLFGVAYDAIRVVVHPQSVVHSMAEFVDGSVKAHLGPADMRIPIQYALSMPDRWASAACPVDFAALGRLDFEEPDLDTFPALRLAIEAGKRGGTAPAVLNAANEVAVAAFLDGRASFTDIDETVARTLDTVEIGPAGSIEAIEAADTAARRVARALLVSR